MPVFRLSSKSQPLPRRDEESLFVESNVNIVWSKFTSISKAEISTESSLVIDTSTVTESPGSANA